jgi:ankyrin repeat protein
VRALLVAAAALALAGCGGSDEPDPELNARLLEAARANRVDDARVLIEQGADVNAKDMTQQSAYLYATSEVGPDPAMLELMLANGADVGAKDSYNGTGIIRAAHRGYPEIVERLLAAGIELDHVNRLGWTALLEAIILGDGGRSHVETVRQLVDAGANVNLADREGVTPLVHAQRAGYDEIAAILVAPGAEG